MAEPSRREQSVGQVSDAGEAETPLLEKAPEVTAVVLNWCGAHHTAACVESLLANDYPSLRILIVDNGSPDGSGAELQRRYPSLGYLQTGDNLGYTGGNNRGIERALADGAEFVLILNNDTAVEPGCVSALVAAAGRHPRAGAVGAKILYFDDPGRLWFDGGDFSAVRVAGIHCGEGRLDEDSRHAGAVEVSFLTGCCMLLPAAVLREVGGFAEDFFAYAEDVEFCLRLTAGGYRLVYEPRARVYHRVPLGRVAPAPLQIHLRDRNRRRIARRALTLREQLAFSTFFYPSRFVHLARYLIRGDIARVAAVWRGMLEH